MALLFLERMSLGAVLITLLLGLALALKAGISETAEAVIRTLVALVNVGMLFFFSHHIIHEWRAGTRDCARFQ